MYIVEFVLGLKRYPIAVLSLGLVKERVLLKKMLWRHEVSCSSSC